MKHRNLNQIETLFHEALDLKPADRVAYLTEACSGDESLYSEVVSLLAAFETGSDFLEQPTFDLGMKVMGGKSDGSLAGKEIGPYRILSPLGKGGMGEVYLADDMRLGRKVALKFLSSELVGDNWAKRQLTKEAQAVAMLDHPNICPVYGIEEHGDYSFIVMQFVEGKTLAELIREKSLDLSELLALARQIVSALAEAHAHGIIHRDIKPKNIMVTPNRQVKVLDFGLAKTIQRAQGRELAADSISHLSQIGLVQGTVAYMSPEQLRGERLDYRSDIFSLGTVLYEMASGKNPYAHGNHAEIISAILTSRPASLRQSVARTPRELDRIVQKCLERDRSQRFQSASELLIEWENYTKSFNDTHPKPWYFNVRLVAATAVMLLLVAVAVFVYRGATRPRTVAILPFVNETGDASLNYLGDGLAEIIINKLSGLAKIKVKSFTVVYGYKGQIDPQKIASELSVDEVVLGKINGNRQSLSLQIAMIDGRDGSQEWAKTYPVELNAASSVNDEVSREVTKSLELWSRGDIDRIRTARRQVNPEAFNEYWLGRYQWRNRDNNRSLKDAIDHFNTAIKLDPNYAEAHAGLADCYALGNVVSYPDLGMDTNEAMRRAERAAKDALDLDENLAEAYTSRGFVNLKFHWDWNAAERDFKRAIELKPDYSLAYFGYSHVLTITGHANEAIVQSQKARDLDPFSPVTALNYCRAFYYARRYDEASGCFDKLVVERPDYTNGHYLRAVVLIKRGMYQEAIDVFEKLFEKDKRANAAMLGYAYGGAGKKESARAVLAQMEKMGSLPPQEFAFVYLGLNDKENALDWLSKAATDRFPPVAYIAVDPMFDSIRSDVRYIEIVRSLNLPLQQPH